ncbi:Cys-Gln thioester bond-forming surface protein [Agromyces humi]|uniref:Cys-Gln thioester bond-forming surface protein n=1 Tax=Agromyces humi TaxID=1766800 RepID=UPI001358008A|nr:Cys-Gln thioester bond-forming surface protein [Agromyces humi]
MKKLQFHIEQLRDRASRARVKGGVHRRLKSQWAKAGIVAAATLTVTAIVGGSLTLISSPAVAAGTGAGFSNQTPYGGFLGNYIAPDGTRIYCMDPAAAWPSGGTGYGGEVGFVGGDGAGSSRDLGGNEIKQLNWILNNYGQTADPVQAAAVSAAVYNFTSLNHPDGHHWIDGNATINASYDWIMGQMAAHWNDGVTPSGQITFQVDGNNNYLGTVTVSGLPGGTSPGTMTLTNGVFSNGATTLGGIVNGGSYAIRGVPPADGSAYKISASASFTAPGGTKAAVNIWYTGGQQRTLSGSGGTSGSFTLSGIDPVGRSTAFDPIVTTQKTTEFLNPGDTPQDQISFSTATAAPWFLAGANYLRIKANGTLYGPLQDEPTRQATVPAGAPVAAHSTVTTTSAQGPTAPYLVTADTAVTESGYYTWVWTIDQADQAAFAASILAPGYHFQDDFGIPAETPFVVPSFDTAATQKSTPGSTVRDTINVNGVVPTQGIDVIFRGYLQDAPAVEGDPIVARCDPSNLVFQSAFPTRIVKDGDTAVSSEDFNLDMIHIGTIYWVAEASISGTVVWTDGCGTNPNEQTKVTVPEFSTSATAQSTPGSTATDTINAIGFFPPEGVDVIFRGYLQDAPAVEGDPIVPRCDPDNLIHESATPTHLAGTDQVTGSSEAFKFSMDHLGTVYWVAEARIGSTIVWTDGCGTNPDETTVVTVPEFSTEAAAYAVPASTVKDTAKVTGFLPPEGVQISFAGYLQPTEEGAAAKCDPENRVYLSTTPHHVAAEGLVDSEPFQVAQEHVGTIFWQETATISDVVVHTGVCGAETEVTKIEQPKLSTVASPGFKGEDATDTATIVGLVPDGAYVTFAVYYTPLGERPAQTPDRILNTSWSEKKFPVAGASTAPFGQVANNQEIVVNSDGQKVVGLGTFHWVATLFTADGQVIQKGEFGDPTETVSLKQSRVKGIMVDSLEFAGGNFGNGGPWFLGGLATLAFLIAAAAVILELRRRRA